MTTRSTIAMENEDGSYTAIYCHFDGYISHHGPILLKYYNTPEKVRALISLGNLLILGANIGESHDFQVLDGKPVDEQCTYFGRDGGRTTGISPHKCFIRRQIMTTQYGYIFTQQNEWLVSSDGKKWNPLSESVKS